MGVVKPLIYGMSLGAVAGAEGLMQGVSVKAHLMDTHGSITLKPALNLYARARLWTTTGQKRTEWVAVHRKHHRFSDVEGDPHSPVVESQGGQRDGVRRVRWMTALMYRREIRDNPTLVQDYAPDVVAKQDYLDTHVFNRGLIGVGVVQPLLLGGILRSKANLRGRELLLGTAAATLTSLFVALRAGGEVNAKAHEATERDPDTHDYSSNLGEGVPGMRGMFKRYVGSVTTAGEAPGHHRHHLAPYSAIFSEGVLDPKGAYLRVGQKLGLLTVNHVAPELDPHNYFPHAEGAELERLQQITPQHILTEQHGYALV